MPIIARSETETVIENTHCLSNGHTLAFINGPKPFLLCQKCAKIFEVDVQALGIIPGGTNVRTS
jgi:hypothetical protein